VKFYIFKLEQFLFYSNLQKHKSDDLIFRGVTKGGQGGTIPRASNDCGGRQMTAGAPKRPHNVASTFFNAIHLLAKNLKFENGGVKLASCPEDHLTSLRSC